MAQSSSPLQKALVYFQLRQPDADMAARSPNSPASQIVLLKERVATLEERVAALESRP
jgi:hypothetical protein